VKTIASVEIPPAAATDLAALVLASVAWDWHLVLAESPAGGVDAALVRGDKALVVQFGADGFVRAEADCGAYRDIFEFAEVLRVLERAEQ
jgi:hypothetical protein